MHTRMFVIKLNNLTLKFSSLTTNTQHIHTYMVVVLAWCRIMHVRMRVTETQMEINF